jgi:hypothetical protein
MKVFCQEYTIICTWYLLYGGLTNVIVGFGSHLETNWTFWLRIRIEGQFNIDLGSHVTLNEKSVCMCIQLPE